VQPKAGPRLISVDEKGQEAMELLFMSSKTDSSLIHNDIIDRNRFFHRFSAACVFRSMPIAVPLSCRSLFRSDVDHHSADVDHGGFLSQSV
jgi:hypothetical protein